MVDRPGLTKRDAARLLDVHEDNNRVRDVVWPLAEKLAAEIRAAKESR
jgi:hypothetical protein